MPRTATTLRALAGTLGVLGVWETVSRSGWVSVTYLPPPTQVLPALAGLSDDGRFRVALGSTGLSWLIALSAATGIGIVLGLVLSAAPRIDRCLRPLLEVLRPLPSVALIPLVVVVFGVGAQTKIILAVFAGTWPVLLATTHALHHIDRVLHDTARVLGVPSGQRLLRLTLPSLVPAVLTGMRLSGAIVAIVLVGVEFLSGGSPGIGQYAYLTGSGAGRMDLVLAAVLAAALLSAAADLGLAQAHQRLLPWTAHARPSHAGEFGTPRHPSTRPRNRRTHHRALRIAVVIAAWLVSWQALTMIVAHTYFPTPLRIGTAAGDLWLSGPQAWIRDIGPSLARLACGWTAAAVLGVLLGVGLGRNRHARDLLSFPLAMARAVPYPLIVPVLVVVLGLGPAMEIVSIALAVLWPVLLHTADGARTITPELTAVLRAAELPRTAWLTRVVLPAAAPAILTGLRTGASIGLILMVVAELAGGINGIGVRLGAAGATFDLPALWAWICLLGALGYGINRVLLAAQRHLLPWQPITGIPS
ncbi:MAG: ABC transporter permease subunit [Umezawaea sp.]